MSEQTLYEHKRHRHQPRNVNAVHAAEQSARGFNTWLAVLLTKAVGTMWMAYAFALLALLGFPLLATVIGPAIALYVVWFSQTFLQLCFLPILSVGQSVLNRKAELQAEEQFNTTQKTYHDIEQIIAHLAAQDAALIQHTEELLKQTAMLAEQDGKLAQAFEKVQVRLDKLNEAQATSSLIGLNTLEMLEAKKPTTKRKSVVKVEGEA